MRSRPRHRRNHDAPAIDMTVDGADLIGDAKARLAALAALFGKKAEGAALAAALDGRLAALAEAGRGKGDAAGPGWTALVLMESRLPRTLAVLLTGAALAVAGVVIQSLVRNRFVGPDTTGTGESAALGLLAGTLLAPGAPVWVKMVVASLAAMAGTALFLQIVRRLPVREVMLVPVAGLVLSGVFGSVVTWIAWEADLPQFVGTWLMSGEFSGVIAGRYELLWIGGAAAGLAWFAADRFAILSLGDQAATGLGLSTRGVMRLGMVVVSVVSAMVVTTVGMIPFVGLVVPNIVARVTGDSLRASIPVVAAGGAGLLLACDPLGPIIRHPYEIPVGTILGVLFRSLSTFLARVMDPNAFAVVQGASIASMDAALLPAAGAIAGLCGAAAAWLSPRLDVLALGREAAVPRCRVPALRLPRACNAGAGGGAGRRLTALVGPVAFFGLLVARLAHGLAPSARHAVLLPAAGLMGGLFFLFLLLKGRVR